MNLPDLLCIGFDGKPAILTRRQFVEHEWFETVEIKGKKVQVRRVYGYVVGKEVLRNALRSRL